MGIVIDPVCQMEVEEDAAAATSVYNGRTYYFCTLGCKTAFEADPEAYAARAGAPVGGVASPDAPVADAPTGAAITMPVDAAIRLRRSVTRFRPDPVPREIIERMLEAAVWAPNHHLTQPWEFIVLTGQGKQRFAEIRSEFRRTLLPDPSGPAAARVLNKVYADAMAASAIIVVTTTAPEDPDLRDDDFGATMCAIQNMLLIATGLGVGTYLRTGGLIRFAPLLEFLGVPPDRRIAGAIYVGYPDHVPQRRRIPPAQKTRWVE